MVTVMTTNSQETGAGMALFRKVRVVNLVMEVADAVTKDLVQVNLVVTQFPKETQIGGLIVLPHGPFLKLTSRRGDAGPVSLLLLMKEK